MNVRNSLVVSALFTMSGCTTIEQVVIETEASYVQINVADKSTTVRLEPGARSEALPARPGSGSVHGNSAVRLGLGPSHEKPAQSVDVLEYEPQVRAEDLWELQQQLDAQKAKVQLYGAASLVAARAPKKSIASKVPAILWFLLPLLPAGIFVSSQTGKSS